MRLLIAALLSLVTSLSWAQTAVPRLDFSWSIPTKRLDGSQLAASEIDKITLYERATTGTVKIADFTGVTASHSMTATAGTHRYFLVVTDTGGRTSGASEDAVATVVAPTVSGPGKVSLQIRVVIP